MAVDKEKNAQFLLTVPRDMLEEIEKYWHQKKFSNRNEAVRDLLQKALAKEGSK